MIFTVLSRKGEEEISEEAFTTRLPILLPLFKWSIK